MASPPTDLLASKLQSNLIASATAVLLTHTSPKHRVCIETAPYVTASQSLPVLVTSPSPQIFPAIFQESIDKALSKAYHKSTLKNYTSGINAFLSFCNRYNISPKNCFPASDQLLCAFISLLPDTLSPSTVNNYISGIRSWHIRNGHPFQQSERLKLLRKAPRPRANSKPARQPVTLTMLDFLASDLKSYADLAIFACATTAFWGLARLGELIPTTATIDKPIPFPIASSINRGTLDSITIHLPWTKTKKWNGNTLHITRQEGPSSLIDALSQHCLLNDICNQALLFSFLLHGCHVPLSKSMLLSRCNSIWQQHGIPYTTGHSFRIGGTTHLLLCGIPPDTVKAAGRWSSDSFLRYWRNLDTLLPQQITNASPSNAGHSGEPREDLAVARRSALG